MSKLITSRISRATDHIGGELYGTIVSRDLHAAILFASSSWHLWEQLTPVVFKVGDTWVIFQSFVKFCFYVNHHPPNRLAYKHLEALHGQLQIWSFCLTRLRFLNASPFPLITLLPSTFYHVCQSMSKVLHLLLFKSGPKERTAHCIGLGGNRVRKLEYVFPSALKEGADILVTTGFARWAFEVVEQEEQFGVFFDFLIVPVASGGALAGMLAGFKLADRLHPNKKSRQRKVIGIDTYNKPAGVLETAILEIAERTPRLIGLEDGAVKAEDLVLNTRYNAGTHSGWSEKTAEAVKLFHGSDGGH